MIDVAISGRAGQPAWEPSARTGWLIAGAITLLAAILRFYNLDGQSLWLDEVSSFRNSRAYGAGGLVGLARADHIAPLHSIALWYATEIGGNNAVALRMPSTIAGVLTVPAIYVAAGRVTRSRTTALVAAFLVAISPFAIWYSQEARMYALVLLFATLYVAVAWPVIERPLKWWELATLTAVTAIGLGMHHYMILVGAAFGFYLLLRGQAFKVRSWAWLATQVIAFAIFAIWLFLTLNKLGNAAGWEKPAPLLWTPYTFYTFIVGFSFGPTLRQLSTAAGDPVSLLIHNAEEIAAAGIATGLIGLLGLRRALRTEYRWAGIWLLMWLAVPITLAVLATVVTNIQYNVRYVIVSYPPLIILLAFGLVEVWRRWLRPAQDGSPVSRWAGLTGVALLGGCLGLSLWNNYRNPDYAKADTRSFARYLKEGRPDGILLCDNNRIVKSLNFYGAPVPPLPLQVDYRHSWTDAAHIWANLTKTPAAYTRPILLIEYRTWEADAHHVLRTQLDAHAKLIDVQSWPGISLRRYQPLRPGAPAV
ncbi:glycosyltransferase family 39 protein [Sphingomonas sp. ID0503]|uniref:glycosyltransferase family 39 protein n=1 Tax=Sphingomonas sp. ID0503 TaxID=3399691 RepID=UPI003AFB62B4